MPTAPGRAAFQQEFGVSRETMERLDIYAALLKKWNTAINLVSRGTLATLWSRHFFDSAQIFKLTDRQGGHWVDIGSGAGFPGMVVALIAKDVALDFRFTFVESDQRKCAFLRSVSRETKTTVTVLSDRIEVIAPLRADVISARALAPLKDLLAHADRHLKADGQAIFLKGATYRAELEEALESWTFRSDEYPSKTDETGIIVNLGEIQRV